MGGLLSRQVDYDDYSDDSSYSLDEEEEMITNSEFHVKREESMEEPDNCFDSATNAVGSVRDSTTHISTMSCVTLDNILSSEEHLDFYEKVSLVYLLYDDCHIALQELNKLQKGGSEKLLYNWANTQNQHSDKWKEMFVEALCVIQNYQVLKSWGYQRKDLNEQFLPHHMFTNVYVNKVRKALYLVCEDLTGVETEKFLELVYSDFIKKGLEFKTFNSAYLEMFFLHWESVGYIKQDNLNNLYGILKQLEYFDLVDNLKKIIPLAITPAVNVFSTQKIENIEKENLQTKTMDTNKKSSNIFEKILSEKSLLDITSCESLDRAVTVMDSDNDNNYKYKIDPENPGICLIINQENFYKEIDTKYRKLLPPPDKSFENRTGTQKDKEDLEATFKMFNFKTEVVNNLTHTEIKEKIENVIKSVTNESSLFICIMSHGDKGVIYGVNSCRVEVETIKNMMCSKNRKNLSGKPKILILQSCQGDICQQISSVDEDITTDGPSSSNQDGLPPLVDLFTFWATVPGYGAIRNKKTGSWFIQSLCEKMKKLGNKEHFIDICTAVVQDVSDKKWMQRDKSVAMVPLQESTLRYRFYLPPVRTQ